LDRETNARLREVLVQHAFVTEGQIEEAFETEPQSAADVGEVLLRMGVLSEQDLIGARAEVYGIDVVDLRSTNPEAKALDLIPDSMAREHYLIPLAVDEVTLAVAVADRPSSELIDLLAQTSQRRSCQFWPHCRTSGTPLRTTTAP